MKKIETSWIYVSLTLHTFEPELSQFSSYELNDFWCPNDVSVFSVLNLLMMYKLCVCVEFLFFHNIVL
jgi:hypothetical protein